MRARRGDETDATAVAVAGKGLFGAGGRMGRDGGYDDVMLEVKFGGAVEVVPRTRPRKGGKLAARTDG